MSRALCLRHENKKGVYMPIELTQDNYFSKEADRDYMSVSQFKDFAGNLMQKPCEDTGWKIANGIIEQTKTTSLLVGSYVDSYFEGTLEKFQQENPEIFKTTGDHGLKADYRQAQDIIRRIEEDDLFSQFLDGEKQVIMTGNLFGVDWKIKIDAYHPNDKIVDLKIMKDMKPIYSEVAHKKVDFIRAWGYDIQGAVYQKIVEINTGKKLPFYIAVATKEKPADIEIIEITQPYLDEALKFVEENIQHVMALKNNLITPTRCGKCFYCILSKKLSNPIPIDNIIPKTYEDYNNDESANDSEEERVPEHGYTLF